MCIVKILAATLLSAPLLVLTSWPTRASEFGCSRIQENAAAPSVEGKNGYFFRILSDLKMRQPLSDHTAQQVEQLSEALRANGTTLVYVPIPTKSLVLPQYLPDSAADFGFDDAIARLSYNEFHAKLRKHGVFTVDILDALRSTGATHSPFLQSDFHWTAWGAEAAAREIAAKMQNLPGFSDLATKSFTTRSIGRKAIISTMRRSLQTSCISSLPAADMESFETVETVKQGSGGLDIFGSSAGGGTVSLVGTSFSDLPQANFAGFLSQKLGAQVNNYAISGGDQFGSILAYLTSDSYLEAPPKFLLWENPIYNNLGKFGDAPLLELTMAARQGCESVPKSAIRDGDRNVLSVAMDWDRFSPSSVVYAFSGDELSRVSNLSLDLGDGQVFRSMIRRASRVSTAGRFYFPINALPRHPTGRMELSFDRLSSGNATIRVCSTDNKNGVQP